MSFAYQDGTLKKKEEEEEEGKSSRKAPCWGAVASSSI